MLAFRHSRLAFLGAILTLAACSALLVSPSATTAFHAESRVAADVGGRDLLYVSMSGPGITDIYTYPVGRRVGSVTYPAPDYAPGLCSNSAGDVFIPTAYQIYEFPHGGASPVAMLSNSFGSADGCSVDPMTGNLAATVSSGAIEIYGAGPHYRWYLPRVVRVRGIVSGGYDGRGNLFVDGSSKTRFFLLELPKGGSRFEKITLSKPPATAGIVQWDGRYLAVGDGQNRFISRFAVNGTHGMRVGSLRLVGFSYSTQFWIQGDTIIAVAVNTLGWFAGFWRYPQGGFAYKTILTASGFYGVTVSVGGQLPSATPQVLNAKYTAATMSR